MDAKTNGTTEAFPVVIDAERGDYSSGLTKRELFAALAMQGFCANPSAQFVTWTHVQVAQNSAAAADALLAELAKERS